MKIILKDKNVLITGAASGIGKALSECFAREGANLFLGSRPEEAEILSHWADELKRKFHITARTYPVDLSLADGPDMLYKQVSQASEPIDVLVNNAGVLSYGNFVQLPMDKQIYMISVNVIAYLKLMRLFLPQMTKRKSGSILNVVSASAFQPSAHHAVYGATKAFMQSLSEAVSQEVKGAGIKICTLNPSYTDTPLLNREGFPKKLWWFLVSGVSSPDEIARKGLKAFKKGKPVYIPGIQNWITHAILTRITPRRLMSFISYWVLKGRTE
jgi:uncharacterized protein